MGGATVLTDLEVDGTTLVVDEVNNRVGVGDGAPGTTLQVKGTAPYVTVQNSTSENSDGGCESKLIFEDHANAALGQIEVSHSGSSDDTKGKMILSTHTGSSLTAAVTIDEAQKVTAAGDVQVTGDIILDDGGSLKEAGGTAAITFDGSGNVTKIGQDSPSSADVLTYDGAKWVAEAPTVGDITGVTAGDGLTGGGTAGSLSLAVGAGTGIDVAADAISVDVSDFMANGSDNRVITATGPDAMNAEANLSFDGSTLAVTGALTTTTTATVGTDLTVTGGDAILGEAGNTTATTISTVTNTGTTVGKALTIAAGSTTTGSNNLNGGDLVLASGSGDGTGTSSIQFKTKVSGTDVAAERMRVHTNGYVGIGTADPATSLHVAGGPAYMVLQNTLNQHGAGEAETRIVFADHAQNFLAQVEASHVGTGDDDKGQLIFSTNNDSGLATALTIDETQKATFAGIVDIDGAVTIDPGASSGTGVTLTHTDVDALAMSVVASNTTADVLSVTANALTSGKVLSAQTSAATGLFLDQNYTLTTASTVVGLDIDFDKTGASTSNNTMIGINLDMDNTTPTGGTNSMTGIKVTPTCTQVSGTGGTFNIKGMEVVATGSDAPEGSTVRALELTATGGDYNQGILINTDDANGWDMKIVSSADTADFCTIAVAANGVTTLTTTDGGGAAAHLKLDPDGHVIIGSNGATPKLVIGDAGTEDTMLAFDGNAQDFRIGIDDGTDTLEIGVGQTHGTTPTMILDPAQNIDIFGMLTIDTAIADEKCSGITAVFTAGESLVRGDVVYFKAADSKMHKVNMTAGNSEAIPAVAMAAADISADAVGKFLMQGVIHDAGTFPTYSVAGRLYAPEAEGPPTQTKPSTDGDLVQVIGWAITADKIYFNPSPDYIEVA